MTTEQATTTTAAATTEAPTTTTSAASTTPSAQSSADPAKAAETTTATTEATPAEGADDLLFSEKKTETDPNAKPTAADQKKYLEGKLDAKDLEGKTDEEIAKLYDEQQAKEAEAAGKVDFAKITLPEGIKLSEANQAELQAFITDNKLTGEQAQAAAQKIADMGAKLQQENLAQWQSMKKGWREKVESDPVLGGKNLNQTVSDCNDIVRKYAGNEAELKEFQQDLIFLGLGNKPSFVRFLKNVHAATKEDGLDGKGGSSGQQTKSAAQRMYPNMKSEADPS